MHTIFGPWTMDNLAVLEVADREWRVRDLQTRRAHGPAFVGVVRQSEDAFYANNLPLECPGRAFPDLESAVEFLELEYLESKADYDDIMPWAMPE